MHFDFRDEFIEHEEDKKSQGDGDEILDKEIVEEIDDLRVDVLLDNAALPDGAVNAAPDKGDEDGNEHDDPDGEHDQVLHEAVVEEGFLVFGFEDEIDRVDQVGEEKTGRHKRAGQPEPAQVRDILRQILHSLEKVGVELGKEFLGKNSQTLRSRIRISQQPGGDKNK